MGCTLRSPASWEEGLLSSPPFPSPPCFHGASIQVPRTKHGTSSTILSASQLRGWNPGSGCWLGPFWVSSGLQVAALPLCPRILTCWRKLQGLLHRVLIQATALSGTSLMSRGISSCLIYICALGHPDTPQHTQETKSQK